MAGASSQGDEDVTPSSRMQEDTTPVVDSFTSANRESQGSSGDSGSVQRIYVAFRPYLIEFLEKVSKHFELVLFTASEVSNFILFRCSRLFSLTSA